MRSTVSNINNRKHLCDIVIDSRSADNEILEKNYKKLVPKECKKLLGPKYALVRNEFSNLRKNNVNPRKNFNNILISFGGSDPLGIFSSPCA